MSKNNMLVTPRGTVAFAACPTASYEFKEEGEYCVKLVIDPNTSKGKTFLDTLTKRNKELIAEKKKAVASAKGKTPKKLAESPIKPELDEDDNETGMVTIKATQKAKVTGRTSGKTFEPKVLIIDGKLDPIKDCADIGSGSEVAMKVELNPYYTASLGVGVSLRLKAVQVFKLVEASGMADTEGFEADEEVDEEMPADEEEGPDFDEDVDGNDI